MTFTPNWGKRSGSTQLEIGNSATNGLNSNGIGISDTMFRFGATRNSPNGINCKPSVDSIMLIYHMIQVSSKPKVFRLFAEFVKCVEKPINSVQNCFCDFVGTGGS